MSQQLTKSSPVQCTNMLLKYAVSIQSESFLGGMMHNLVQLGQRHVPLSNFLHWHYGITYSGGNVLKVVKSNNSGILGRHQYQAKHGRCQGSLGFRGKVW